MAKKLITMDGNTAAAYASYAFTDVATIYPITPSSPMAEIVDEWAAHGKKNIFGQTVKLVELQSEGGAAGAMHGSLTAGALTTTYTASQGLLLMIPNMYKISGEFLPGVFHVSARTLATHALCIFGDHSDVMATRQTGVALLASSSVQEVMDLAALAHLISIKSRIPFVHFFDGFRTSHEVQKIEAWDYDELKDLLDFDSILKFRKSALNPDNPKIRGTAQNPDIFYQARESGNIYYEELEKIAENYFQKVSEKTGRSYSFFNYTGSENPEKLIIAMGSINETIEETLEELNDGKTGLIKVRLYRPFYFKHLIDKIPLSVKTITVLDRTKEPGATGDPLYLDVRDSLSRVGLFNINILSGRYGLGSKDMTPAMVKAVIDNMDKKTPKNFFNVGIKDDLTNSSLDYDENYKTKTPGTVSCKFWGLGSDGTVGANKTAIKIIGDKTDSYAQGYFAYDSKKSGGVTISHLRFGKNPIKSTYLVQSADYIACHNQSYLYQYDMLKDLKNGGTFLLNTVWSDGEIEEQLPAKIKRQLSEKNAKFYALDGLKIAKEIGLGTRINMIMQAAFFKLNKDIMSVSEAVKYLKDGITKTYGKKGQKILDMNFAAVDKGIENVREVKIPDSWKNAKDESLRKKESPKFIEEILIPMNAQEGDALPVSTFKDLEGGGSFPLGTSAYEKRGVAPFLPLWKKENCIQCNQCSFVCPHAAIRPFLIDDAEKKDAPVGFETIKAVGRGLENYGYRMQVSVLDCLGCGNCADICPAKNKALEMQPFADIKNQEEFWDYSLTLPYRTDSMDITSVKGSQFARPYLEFSGACAGCGETPYLKVITQLFGDRMLIANATGCSSIWGASAPSMPYTKDEKGHGPAWANSLFEDNAEFGLGMREADHQMKEKLLTLADEINRNKYATSNLKNKAKRWKENIDKTSDTRQIAEDYIKALEKEDASDKKLKEAISGILDRKEYLIKKSFWIVGGDGWAYDIGYGGLDHVLASDEDVNVLVFDTEVYSNTGGQASKATPEAAVAKFAASGKRIKKKDLGRMAIAYGYVYVAQVGMGADKNQFMKAIKEAESYKGPSLIIAYAPCINHGLKKGMGKVQENIKDAVDAGYWHLYRFNPDLKKEGKRPFVLDSKEPSKNFKDFIMDQVRYSSLEKEFPDIAEDLFIKAENDAKERLEAYKKLAE
ncbi:MAG: pyruvate:ferredoxin (flavodoxin) oxidoreductase [Clostridiales Family XIII bacterium]|jgi:pyruvate-ferredoxin/flavodoxin oxidoreductase|nr:pyruvate:ferredoxin (flavodoxin) oxidoreductase [Clostridiales Family XIII bacterium]